jgi:hypothetical protein
MLVADAVLGERLREGDVQVFGGLSEGPTPEAYDFLIRLVQVRAAAADVIESVPSTGGCVCSRGRLWISYIAASSAFCLAPVNDPSPRKREPSPRRRLARWLFLPSDCCLFRGGTPGLSPFEARGGPKRDIDSATPDRRRERPDLRWTGVAFSRLSSFVWHD